MYVYALDRERWTGTLPRNSGASGSLAVAYGPFATAKGAIAAVLANDTVQYVLESSPPAGTVQPYGQIGATFSTCSRNTYLGVTCDACPVNKRCETGEDQIRSVRLTEPGVVQAEILVAVADVDITDVRALGSIPADLLRFDLVFVEEDRGTWRLLEAEWGSAGPADFL